MVAMIPDKVRENKRISPIESYIYKYIILLFKKIYQLYIQYMKRVYIKFI